MIFNRHSNLQGEHAFLSASKYRWLNYDEEQLAQSYCNSFASPIGTILHSLAHTMISNRIKVAKSDKKMLLIKLLESGIPRVAIDVDGVFDNFMRYVNDAIGFAMQSEVVLFHSENCFGTTDAICYRNNVLRIHDYKSGNTPAHIEQLLIYAALFFLEYKEYKPEETDIELRIYQGDEIVYHKPVATEIRGVMQQIIEADKSMKRLKEEV